MVKDWNVRCTQFARNLYDRHALKEDKDYDEFLSWMLSKENSGARGLDKHLLLKAYKIHLELKNNFDNFSVICGKEGIGKSTLAINFCATVSPSFSLRHICYNIKDLLEVVSDLQPGDSVLMDEGLQFLFSRRAMNKGNVDMVEMISMMRQLNVNVVICVPNFWTIETYIREHRVKSLIEVLSRGKYKLMNQKAATYISSKGKVHKNIGYVKLNTADFLMGDFMKCFPDQNDLNEASYTRLKRENFDESVRRFKENVGEKKVLKFTEVARELGVSEGTVRNKVASGDIPTVDVAGRPLVPTAWVNQKKSEFENF